MVMAWVMLVGYVVGWCAFVRIAPRIDHIFEDDWAFAAYIGLFWPLVALCGVGYLVAKGFYAFATQPLPKSWMPRRRKRADLDRIRELEHELGLTSKPPPAPGVEALNASTYTHGHAHPNGYCPGGVIPSPTRPDPGERSS